MTRTILDNMLAAEVGAGIGKGDWKMSDVEVKSVGERSVVCKSDRNPVRVGFSVFL